MQVGGKEPAVKLDRLAIGRLLAEGGEGLIFDVGDGRVYKQLRTPRELDGAQAVVDYPSSLEPRFAARLRSSCAWPLTAVVGDNAQLALGSLLPRAPANFWLRHRDGQLRLATLSYLSTDPDRIAVAYGVHVPAPGSPERVALAYALSRVVEAFGGAPAGPGAAHGDLSGKNILWSLRPAPAVYLLDCDGATVPGEGGLGDERPRAITPNWDDPARLPGRQGLTLADRYAIALAFLRVVGAANFPVQARQRQRAGGPVNIDLDLPRWWRHLPDMPAMWGLCERALSQTEPDARPTAAEWAWQLEELLSILGADPLAAEVRACQGDPGPSAVAAGGRHLTAGTPTPTAAVADVVVRPVIRERAVPTWQLITGAQVLGASASAGALGAASPRQLLRRSATAWAAAHRLAVRLVRTSGRRRHGLRRLAGVLTLDLAGACVLLFLVGMIVSPWIGL